MMRRRFNWEYMDIFYKRKNQRKNKKHLSKAWYKKFLSPEINFGDLLLYEAMNSSWYRQPEVQEDDFWEEVSAIYNHYFPDLKNR